MRTVAVMRNPDSIVNMARNAMTKKTLIKRQVYTRNLHMPCFQVYRFKIVNMLLNIILAELKISLCKIVHVILSLRYF